MRKIFICLLLAGIMFSGCKQQSYFETVDSREAFSERNSEESDSQTDSGDSDIAKAETGYVFLTGAVNNPGVYEIGENARLFMVIEAAGGLREDAAGDYFNQAKVITDGESIHIPTVSEAQAYESEKEKGDSAEEDDGLININKADMTLLMTLPGIGESKAKQILEYREKQGPFNSIEDIMNIGGIKEGVFNRIKDYIKV